MPKGSGKAGTARKTRKPTAKKPRADKAVAIKPAAKAPPAKATGPVRKASKKAAKAPSSAQPKKDRRGTPKGKATGVARGRGGGGKIGNPPYVPTAENCIRVEAMVAAGAEQWFIAEELQISEDTLQRHHRLQLDHGKKRVDWKVGGSIAQKALAGDADMQKFYAARRAGWKTTTAVEASGPGGGPIEYRDLSDEELDARIARLTSHVAAVAKD